MKPYDVLIIGGGPAGLAAAIYASRAGLSYALIEQGFPGGQVLNTAEVDNYPGFPEISGMDLGMKWMEHAQKLGMQQIMEEVTDLEVGEEWKTVRTFGGEYVTKNILFCTGAAPKTLGVPGEERLRGKGVSYCATCDGAFFRHQKTAVIGGGDTAVSDALYLSALCQDVYLIHRRDQLRAAESLQKKVAEKDNIHILWNSQVREIQGEERVSALLVDTAGQETRLDVNGVFVAVGIQPNSSLLKGKVDTDSAGYILTNDHMETSIRGVYAAGDVRKKFLRQIITAAADGAIAIESIVGTL
ncbi:MAG: thioredoxin-disulfide reductase [Lachnospirales bacterium]